MPRERRGVDPLRIPLYDPFALPVPVPTADPGDDTLLCLQINEQYRKYIIGALWRLCYPDAWQGAAGAQEIAVKRFHELIAIISEAKTCEQLIFDAGGGSPLAIGDIIWTIAPCNQYRLEMGSGPHQAADWPELTPFLIAIGWMLDTDTEFTLPDITDVYLSMDTSQMGQFAGENNRDLTVEELPNHNHFIASDHSSTWQLLQTPFNNPVSTLDGSSTAQWSLRADGGNISPRDKLSNNPAITPTDFRSKRLYLRACIIAATPPEGTTTVTDPCCGNLTQISTVDVTNIYNTEINNFTNYDGDNITTINPVLLFDGTPSKQTFDNEDALCFALHLFFKAWVDHYNQQLAALQTGEDPTSWEIGNIAIGIVDSLYGAAVAAGLLAFDPFIVLGLGAATALSQIGELLFGKGDPQQADTLPDSVVQDLVCLAWNNLRGNPITQAAWENAFQSVDIGPVINNYTTYFSWGLARHLANMWQSNEFYFAFLEYLGKVIEVMPDGGYQCDCCRLDSPTAAQATVRYYPGTSPQMFNPPPSGFGPETPPNGVWENGQTVFSLDQPELVTSVTVRYHHYVNESFTVWDMRHQMECYDTHYAFQGPNDTDLVTNVGSQEAQHFLIERLNGNRFVIVHIDVRSEPIP